MLTNKKNKIVATLGPACSTRDNKDMIDAGLMCLELIFHTDYEDVKEKINIIKSLMNE
jgi:pyruvate kinase